MGGREIHLHRRLARKAVVACQGQQEFLAPGRRERQVGLSKLRRPATPRDVVDKLNRAFVAALQAPETKTRFAQLLAEPVGNTPEQFGTFMKQELTRYETVVKASGARVD